jgi:PAS domain S-box-containing protein
MSQEDVLQRELLDELFATVPVSLAVVNSELRFIRINGQMSALYGKQGDEFTGMTIAEAIPDEAGEFEPQVLRAFAGESIRGLRFRARRPGDERRFKASFIPIKAAEGAVTEVLIMLAESLVDEDVERTLRLTHERLDLTLEGTRAGIFEWHSSDNELRWSAGMGPLFGRDRGWTPDGYENYLGVIHPDDRSGLQSGVERAVAAGADYEREFRCIWPDGRERWLHSRVQVVPEGETHTLLGLVSDIHERKVRELADQFLSRTSYELGRSLDPEDTAQRLAERIVPEFADWCEISVLDSQEELAWATVLHRDPEKTELAAGAHARMWSHRDRVPEIMEQIRRGEAVTRTDIPAQALEATAVDGAHLEMMRTLHAASMMIVPMTARGRLVGILALFADSPARRFGEISSSIAMELGRRAGIALDNASLMAAERQAVYRLSHLQAVTDAALDNLELDDLLTELLRRLQDMTAAEFAAIHLYDRDRGELVLTAAQGLGDELEDIRLKPGEGIAGLVLESGRSLFIEDVPGGKYRNRFVGEPRDRVKSLLAVPLTGKDGIVGVLVVGTTTEHRSFSDPESELLEMVAERAARAIVNASIYTQARKVSTLLQGSLLPAAFPSIPGYELEAIYRPGQDMTEVGGDWYDVFPLADGRFAIALGDVVGRGLRAAALMGQLRAATRAYAREHSDPATVLSKVDELVEELVAVPFATMVLLALDPETGMVEAASAGHPPPVTRSGGLLDIAAGPALGALVDSREACFFEMEPGELLVLYTDGLVETRASPLQERLDKLARSVADGPTDPVALLSHLETSMLGGQIVDDTATIVLKRL